MRVCAVLDGGLGNQLFQYSCGLAIANASSRALWVDTRAIRARHQHGGRLINELFDIPLPELKDSEKSLFSRVLTNYRVKALGNRSGLFSASLPFVFDGKEKFFLETPSRCDTLYCAGYHQSEEIFASDRQGIAAFFRYGSVYREEFERLRVLLQDMIVIHVRLGDYGLKNNASIYKKLTANYYRRHIEALRCDARLPRADIVLVSDDIDLARRELGSLGPMKTLSEMGVRSEPLMDFVALSAAQRLVIANSTFSWWAGWLAEAWHGAVIKGPDEWYVKGAPENPVPERWL